MLNNVIQLFKNTDLKLEHIAPKNEDKNQQLNLPLDRKETLIFVYSFEFTGMHDFYNFTSTETPRVIVDMRLAPRLDFIRPSRNQAFELFSAFDISYQDLLGRLGINSYICSYLEYQSIVDAFISLYDKNDSRSIVVIFDNTDFLNKCHLKLTHFFEVILQNGEALQMSISDGARQRM